MSPIREEHSTGAKRGLLALAIVFAATMLLAIGSDGMETEWIKELAKSGYAGLFAAAPLWGYGALDALRNDAKAGP